MNIRSDKNRRDQLADFVTAGAHAKAGTTVGVKATQVLTFSGNPAADDTVTIGSVVYTYKATPAAGTSTAVQVKTGATQDEALTNLAAAVNGAQGQSGVLYGSAAADGHPDVTGAVDLTANTLTITAKVSGTAANSIATTEASTVLAWGAATMAGGVASTYWSATQIAAWLGINEVQLNRWLGIDNPTELAKIVS